jgi:hypothetical protein
MGNVHHHNTGQIVVQYFDRVIGGENQVLQCSQNARSHVWVHHDDDWITSGGEKWN